MRAISPAALATLSQSTGVEPINLVQVFWTPTTSIVYGDRKFEHLGIVGRLLEISNLENVVNITKSSNTSAITVKFDDSDGSIKQMFDYNDIIKRTVYVYQWFEGLPITEAFIIFEGQIATPMSWKEGERTITFDVLSKIEDLQYGFSADEGEFTFIPENIVGRSWPLPFGTVSMLPAMQLFELPEGLLQESVSTFASSDDSTKYEFQPLPQAYWDAFNNANECGTKSNHCFTQAQLLEEDGIRTTHVFVLPSLSAEEQSTETATDQWILKAMEYQDQRLDYEQQFLKLMFENFEENSKRARDASTQEFTVQGGEQFPQNVPTALKIGGVTYTGQFKGSSFTVLSSSSPFAGDDKLMAGPLTITDEQVAQEYQQHLNQQDFFYSVAGTSVQHSSSLNYIICLFHVNLTGVFAQYNGITRAVPRNLYVPSYVNFGPIQATYIIFPKALSLVDAAWSDEIFCNIVSPVGPNIVDILIWFILNYTTKTYDVASFNLVRTQVAAYPAGFALIEQGNVVDVLQNIAFQARCALWYKQGKFYIKFLADMSGYVETINENDVEFGTMEISCTPTEDLVTKYIAAYTLALNQERENLVIWYYNQQKYGLLEKKDNYFIFNISDLVIRSSMFWLVRYSNTWKRLKLSTFLTKLALETFDYVLINFTHPWVSSAPVVGMVESCLYDSGSNRVELTIWLPIRFGEMTPYPFATPYAISPTLVFPTREEQLSGQTDSSLTGNQAEGELFEQIGTNQQVTPSNRPRPGKRQDRPSTFTPSDSNFTPPVYETALDPESFQDSPPPEQSTNITKQHIIKPVRDGVTTDTPGVWPGKIKEKKGSDTYLVNVFFDGLEKDPIEVEVKQLEIDPDDEIPKDTFCHVIRQCILKSKDSVTKLATYTSEYTMQVPVWKKPKEEEE